ncbi:MAG TPA: DUF1501 domain-containing protein [Phycisphaerae bacterium]|nr:DUF1501 domain-containing protein [Phycisphaerae bacterium]HRW52110.1 DUF1501 domain-containing protein [Phycisphaerae bacterium]
MTDQSHGCDDYEFAMRRSFLRMAGRAAALGALSAPAWLPKLAFAVDEDSQRDVIIQIFLRGGADGLTMCVPFAETEYYNVRSTIAVPAPDSMETKKAIDLDGFFGLPPALADLKTFWDAGELAVIHATGFPFADRSHFRSMDLIEYGRPDVVVMPTGWLGRHLASRGSAPNRILGMTPHERLPIALHGAPDTVAVPDIDTFGLEGNWLSPTSRPPFLANVYNNADVALKVAAEATTQSLDLIDQLKIGYTGPANGASYPNSAFGRGMETIARMIKGDVGLEAACIDIDGWDFHAQQLPLTGGMFYLMSDLNAGLLAFREDLGAAFANVTIVVMSEFGRRVAQNGSNGTDHGTGGAMFVLGGHVNGGQVFTDWPGLYSNQLYEMIDLPITIDARDVLAEILQKRAGASDLAGIFPGYSATFHDVVSAT